MDENKNVNINPEEPEVEQQAQPVESVEAPVEEMWNAPASEQPAEPAEKPQVLAASNTPAADNVAQPVYVAPSAMFDNNTADHSYAVISLVLGIIGLVMCCSGTLSIILGVIGLILGIICRKHGNREGVSLAGIVTSAVALGLGLASILISSVFWVALFEEMLYENPDLFETMPDGYIKFFGRF